MADQKLIERMRERDAELAQARQYLKAENALGEELAQLVARAQSDVERVQSDPERLALAAKHSEAERALLAAVKKRIWRDKILRATKAWSAMQRGFKLRPTPAVQAVRTWLDGGCKHDLVLRGPLGTGKTTAAIAAVMKWVEPDVELDGTTVREKTSTASPNVSWLRPHALISAIEHSYDPKAPQLHKYVVLEDLGRESRPEFVEAFCELLDRDGHVILITTNMTKEDMRARYEPRVIDRLRDRAEAVDLKGESMRRKNDDF